MKSLLTFVGLGLIAATLLYAADGPKAQSRTTVAYEAPEKFTDFTDSGFGAASDKELKYLTDLFTAHIESLAKECLAEGARLEMDFKDIDLAGRFEPERGPNMQNVRIYRDIAYPRMVFTFKLIGSDGKILAEGERKLTDMNYQMKLRMPMADPEYRYDKDLLSDWLRSEIKRKTK